MTTNSPSVIRAAKRSDLQAIIDLATESIIHSQSPFRDTSLEAVQQFRRKDLDLLHTLVDRPELGLFVAEQNEKIVGHVIVLTGTLESVSGEMQGWIIDLSVIPELWGTGIARDLAQRAENFVKQKGIKYIGLGVTSINERAIRFYEKLGYAEERIRMIKVL